MAGTLKCVYIMILIYSLCFLVAGGIKFNGECRNINDCYRKYTLVPYGYMRCIRGYCKLQRDVKFL
ncbi:putative Late nodulin [Medicago truncatula]|uniref:Putative Late nodulin n=1 Tax=Medicago truncatula TaxID=3880 RepID=A0A396GXR4_MEDTR|nr:putative Late nodulin [Medicago truncatula]